MALLSRRRSDRVLAVCLAVASMAAATYRHVTFRSTTFDLAIFDQALWKLSRGRAPEVTVTGWNIFGDHFSPALALFTPLYALVATPLWLLLAQAVAAAAAVLALPPLLDQAGLGRRFHRPLLLALVLSPLLWNALLYDFHATTLAPPLVLMGLTAALRDQRRALLLIVAALLLLRDDLAIAAILVTLTGVPGDRRGRLHRLAVCVGCLAWFGLGGVIAAVLDVDRHFTYLYGGIAASPGDALLHPARTVARVVPQLLAEDAVVFIVTLLATVAFLPLLAPRRLLAVVVLVLPLLVADYENFRSAAFQYGAVPMAFLLHAAADGLARLPDRLRNLHAPALIAALAVTMFVAVGPPSTTALTRRPTVDREDARAALATIRADDGVTAIAMLGPHLSQRHVLLPFPYPFRDVQRTFPLDPEVTRTDRAAQARVDVVVVGPTPLPGERRVIERFLASPAAADFSSRSFGEVRVLRRVRPPSAPA